MLPDQAFETILEVGIGTGAVAEKMVEKLRRLYDQHKLDDASSVVAEDMAEFLENWWYAHILTEDMSYKEFAESR